MSGQARSGVTFFESPDAPLELTLKHAVDLGDYAPALRRDEASDRVFEAYTRDLRALNKRYWQALMRLPPEKRQELGAQMALTRRDDRWPLFELMKRDAAMTTAAAAAAGLTTTTAAPGAAAITKS
jgi:hypothetical protein